MPESQPTETDKKRILIIGFGSIGKRHARLLSTMGYQLGVVTRRKECKYECFASIGEAIGSASFDIAAICSPTSRHLDDLAMLESAGFKGKVLLEKPVSGFLCNDMPEFSQKIFLGYNLRYHPVIQKIKETIAGKRIFSAQFSVGQYLPDWRPETDYRKCYSARHKDGGGVLRDLSHEIDLSLWLLGKWKRLISINGRWGDLEIDSEDTADILASYASCPSVSIHLDYHNRFPRRRISMQAEGASLEADLIENSLRVNDERIHFDVQRDYTYLSEWQDILNSEPLCACDWAGGIEVMKFIEAAENSNRNDSWEKNL